MILTLYYLAATCIQSWRLNTMRKKISQLLHRNGSLVLYKEMDVVASEVEGNAGPHLRTISSNCCLNRAEARVEDLLWYSNGKRACSVFPQQKLDVTDWISFQEDRSMFPVEVSGPESHASLRDDQKLHVLLEADYMHANSIRDVNYCQMEKFGIPRVWKAGEYFSIIVETDVEHLANLGSHFMTGKITIDDGMELIRIQTVIVEGRPCILLNTDTIPVMRSPAKQDDTHSTGSDIYNLKSRVQMSPVQWCTHVDLLQSFSQAAKEAASSQEQVIIPGYSAAVIVAGNQPLNLCKPTVLSIPDVITEETEKSEQNEATEHEGSLDSEVCQQHTIQEEPLPATGLVPQEDKSVDSFYSLTEEIEHDNHGKQVPSPIPEEDRTQRLQSPSTVSVTSHHPVPSPVAVISKEPVQTKQQQSNAVILNNRLAPRPANKPEMKLSSTEAVKPPNILVYSESSITVENVKAVLQATLQRHKYTIYTVSKESLLSSPWTHHTVLLVVCGTVSDVLAPLFMNYLLEGGHILCLCSDFLYLVLPTFRTAEVRERELVRFSYAQWKQVRMMHHIFCYQASPAHTRFSPREPRVPDDPAQPPGSSGRILQMPSTVEVLDKKNQPHTLKVQVLGTEETWHTPSLLLAKVGSGSGCVVFSQIHLELDPTQYEDEEETFAALKESNRTRLEIMQDLLTTHLGLECSLNQKSPLFTPAYFLGRYELKQEFLNGLKEKLESENILKMASLTLQFCGKGIDPPKATCSIMPVLVHACPENFSTIEYFENLQSDIIGRLLIYSEVMTSSMEVLSGPTLQHGLAVVPYEQTNGTGRSNNTWLSPEGCAMFSLQLHIPLTTYLGQHIPLLQHIVALSVVSAICNLSGYQNIDLRLKWPNDIYAGRNVKIGGLAVNSRVESAVVVCNIGCGINLDNKYPTTCINEMIAQYNSSVPAPSEKVAPLSREKLFAVTFTQLEALLAAVQDGHIQQVLHQYYSYWLHSNAEVTVVGPRGSGQKATVVGVDDFGFLRVRGQDGASFSVHPDGNSFDMLRGLVAPKII